MDINEFLIKVSGKFPIENELKLGGEVVIIIRGGVVKKEEMDKQNGTMDVVFVVKPTEIQMVKNEDSN